MYTNQTTTKSDSLDDLVDDPTASLSVNQAGDYLQGVVWGTGDGAVTIEPSDYLLEKVEETAVADYFQFVTKTLLHHMNHSSSGLNTAMKPYFYDQVAFGTSGIGAYKNSSYIDGTEDNALIFRNYGVDNIAIDEGKNGLVDTIFVNHQWRVNRIVKEFAIGTDGMVSQEGLAKLPKSVQDAYKEKNVNKEFTVVQGVYEREDYHPRLKGKRGTKYIGTWFLDESDSKPFFDEDYEKLPIAVCRAIKIRGEIWGRSSGSLLISSIKSVNYMFSKSVEVIEKMASLPLGTWNGALFGDSVLDTSADGLTVFNQALMGNSKNPVFPLIDVGDPTGLINFLIPYLNDKITTGFKVDTLLDFNSAKDMTATESLQRYAIRGRSLSGLLQQQKTEELEPLIHRSISLLLGMNVLGINPLEMADQAEALKSAGRPERILPDAVLACISEGKTWYKVKFNNELEKLTRTEGLERIIQYLNALSMIAALFPPILEGVKWYDMMQDINEFLGFDYFISEDEFKEKMKEMAKMRQQQMAIEAAKGGSEAGKNVAQGKKAEAEAKATI